MCLKKIISFYISLIFILSFESCQNSQEINSANFEGVIFKSKNYTPTSVTIFEMEKSLKAFLVSVNEDSSTFTEGLNRKEQLRFITQNLNKYKRRYSGVINAKNEEIIQVEGILIECLPKDDSWKNEEWKINDGGECCWHIYYNTTTKRFERFSINSNG